MKITALAIRHPVTTIMVFLGLFILGLVSLSRLELELFPDISMPTVAIFTAYPGVGPFEVESAITKPIEEELSTINGVEQISSTSSEGVSVVIVNFAWSKDMDTVVSEIREVLMQIEESFPEGVERSGVFKFNPQHLPSIVYNVYSETQGIDVRKLAEEEIVPVFEKVEGVARAEVYGGAIASVVCRINLDTVGKLQIPISQILQAFSGENIDLPGGAMTIDDEYVILRTIGEFAAVDDIGYVLIGYKNGIPIFLKDVADIAIDSLTQEEFVRADGYQGVTVTVQRQPGRNTVTVNDGVKKNLEGLRSKLPESIKIIVQSDQSVSVMQSIGSVSTAAWQGGLLAIFVLLFFLRNLRSTLIVATVIPMSVVATFSLMDFGGLSMNMVSLMGITLGVGMFVDNSIVVLEASYRKQLTGMGPVDAAREATAEVGKPIIASTLTTVAVFVPMVFVEGMAGLLFDDLTMTISFALLVSLAVALTFIPLLCAKLLRVNPDGITNAREMASLSELSLADVEVISGNRIIDAIAGWIQRLLKRMDLIYERVVVWALDHGFTIVLLAVLLLGLSVGSVLLLGMEFLPETDEGEFSVYVETKMGSSFDATTQKVIQMEQIVMDLYGDDLALLTSQIGRGGSLIDAGNVGSNLATLHVNLVDKEKRSQSIWEMINQLDKRFEMAVLDIRYSMNVEGIASLASSASGETDPVVVELTGDNLDSLYDFSLQIRNILREVSGVRNIRVSHHVGKPELQFRINRREALSLGLSPLEIAATVRASFKGTTVTRYSTDEESFDVVLILRDEDRIPEKFSSIFFINPTGNRIPLENLVDIVPGTGPLSISRKNRTRVITVTAGLTRERALNRVMADLKGRVSDLGPPPIGINLDYTGTSLEMAESFSSLLLALLFAVALVYMVMASQFESLLHPLIVMFSIPFAIIGLVGALLVTGTTFSLLAFVGAILLVGIVVNNAIVLIDYINILRKLGMPLKQAIIQGGKTRLKPILMTTLTTIFGLLPMSLGIGTGSEIRAPMGRAVVGGLSTSTLITLILIPVLYWILESKIRRKSHETVEA